MVSQGSQTISFGVLGDKPLTASPITISATASSGLPVTFASMSSTICTVSNNLVTLIAAGSCTIRAAQAGNASFSAALNVDRSFMSGVGPDAAIQYSYDAAGNVIELTRSPLSARPDLTVRNLSIGKITVNANGSFNIPATFEVHNIGWATAQGTWTDRGYLSVDSVLHDSDQPLGGSVTHGTNLGVGASYLVSTTFTTSTNTSAGTYTLIVRGDGGVAVSGQYSATGSNNVAEREEINNAQVAVVSLTK
jgi:hypothetical protein